MDPDIPERMKGIAFGRWVSSYYNHPCYDDPYDPSHASQKSMSSLQTRMPAEGAEYKRPTNETYSMEELLASLDQRPDIRSERAYMGIIDGAVLYENGGGSLLIPERERSSGVEPISMRFIYGLSSVWSVQWAIWELEKDLAKRREAGQDVRDVRTMPVVGANHFVSINTATMIYLIIDVFSPSYITKILIYSFKQL